MMPGRALQVLLFSIPELIYVDNFTAVSCLMEPTQQRRLLGLATPVLAQSPQEGAAQGRSESPTKAHHRPSASASWLWYQSLNSVGTTNAYSSGIVRRKADARRNRMNSSRMAKCRTTDNILTGLLLRFVRC